VQVEDVAGVGLAAGRAPQQERHLPVGVGVLGQVVVDDQRVTAAVEEVLAHRATRVRGEVLDRGGLVGGRGDDDRVLERTGVLELLPDLDHRRHALADRHVDADEVRVLVVDDRVDADRRLAGLAVADDQLALAAADVRHRVDRLDARQHRLLHGLARHHAGCLELGRALLAGVDVALAVERVAERVDHTAEQLVADGDVEQLARALDLVALLDPVPLAEQHGADVVRLEVEREPGHVVRQREQLQRHAVVEAVHATDAVGHGQHRPDLREVCATILEPLDALLEDARDLVWLDLHLEVSLRGLDDLLA
jgi:hypothetical protein